MIWEAVLYATAKTSRPLRRLGLVGDAVALWSRGTRRRTAWRSHEVRCQAFIEAALAPLASRRTVLVLGSGLLRDVPIWRLAERFERVVLVDAVHLLPARWKAWRCRAEIVVADLSRDGALASYHADPTIDLVISANLLSQMPLAHRRHSGDWHSPEPGGAIARRHLGDLSAFRASACLLTDVAYRDVGQDGSVSAEVVLVDETLLRPADATWDWEVAPRGEIDRAFARIHRVGAWLFPRPASR